MLRDAAEDLTWRTCKTASESFACGFALLVQVLLCFGSREAEEEKQAVLFLFICTVIEQYLELWHVPMVLWASQMGQCGTHPTLEE